MNKLLLYGLLPILAFCAGKETADITGKWYIDKTTYLAMGVSKTVSFIDCPYMEFKMDSSFVFENGMELNQGRRWRMNYPQIELRDSVAHLEFKIIYLSADSMVIESAELRFELTKLCK